MIKSKHQPFIKTLNRQLDYYGLSTEENSKNKRRCVESYVERNKVHSSSDEKKYIL